MCLCFLLQAIDTERKGYVDADYLSELLCGDVGTAFFDKELMGAFVAGAPTPHPVPRTSRLAVLLPALHAVLDAHCCVTL